MSKLKKILSRVLSVPEEQINDETSPANTEAWDSFNGLMMVSELEQAYKISFSMDDITSVKCVADIKKNLLKYGISQSEI